jgi:hypothetical protein
MGLLLIAQVLLTFSHQPVDALQAVIDRRGHVAIYKATACNYGNASVNVPGGRVIQSAETSGLSIIDPDLVRVTALRQRSTWPVKVAQIVGSTAPLASSATAAINDVPQWGKLVGPVVMIVTQLAHGRVQQAESVLPGVWIATDGLISLTPGACTSRLLMAKWDGKAAPISTELK